MISSAEKPQPLREVMAETKRWVERLGPIWVEGQLIEINTRSGVMQFLTMRDAVEEVSVTITTTRAVLDAAGPLAQGTMVAAWVKPVVWAKSGKLVFDCRDIRPSGEGRLLAAIEQRKRMLHAEGLFDPALKKPLPFLPRRIGLITGAGSAAERDVVENLARRWPAARLEIRHTLTQGPSAAGQIIEALAELDADADVDVIIIARGGGSLEDLLPFSEEALVRAAFACTTPLVSAIGHEPDTPILDLVADLRASTPTDAAKRVVPDAAMESDQVNAALARIRRSVISGVAGEQRRLDEVRSRPVLRDPSASLDGHSERLATVRERLRRAIAVRLREERGSVVHTIDRIRALSPHATLQRGYAILAAADGHTVDRVATTKKGATLTVQLADGQLDVTVTTITPQEQP